MPYPAIFLTRPIRRAIMCFFIAAFFIIAPILILYTAGYRYDVQAPHIKQTGVISIDVEPRDANVYLNTVRIQNKIPIRLANRAPGTYHLRIEKQGYDTWEKDITVGSRQTTYIKNITLFKNTLPVAVFDQPTEHLVNIVPSSDGAYIMIVISENNITTIEMIDTTKSARVPIKRESAEAATDIHWSPWYHLAAVISTKDKRTVFELFDPEEGRVIQTLALSTPSATLASFLWEEHTDTPALFVQDGIHIMRIGKNDIHTAGRLASDTSAWYVDDHQHIWEYTAKTNTLKDNHERTQEAYILPSKIERIIHVNDHRIIAQGPQTIIVIPRDDKNGMPGELHTDDIRVNPSTGEWYTWSSSELWSIYPNGQMILLNRTGEKIVSVQPLDAYGQVLLATSHTLFGFNPGYYLTQKLFSGGDIETIGINQKLRRIFFLGTIGSRRDIFAMDY